MISDLTKPVSGRLLFLLLLVTIGSEVSLYFSRYSYFFSDIYDAIMIASIFAAWKLHPKLAGPGGKLTSGTLGHSLGLDTEGKPNKKHFWQKGVLSQFAAVFLLFNMGSVVINFYSYILFPSFNENYQEYVDDSVEAANSGWVYGDEEGSLNEPSDINSVFEWFDYAGYDIYTSALAGFEEVYRLGYIILVLMVFKRFFPQQWSTWPENRFILSGLFISSLSFGVGHALDTPQSMEVTIGTIVTFTNMGLLLGILLLWSRNLWLLIAVHAVYDILMTIEWYYYPSASLVFSGVLLVVWIIETAIRSYSGKQKKDYYIEQ